MKKVIALDFDGTLCENAWPGIGDPKWPVIRAALEEQRQGALLILWTTREGEALDEALAWCKDVGLNLDGVNTSAQSWKDAYQNDTRKTGPWTWRSLKRGKCSKRKHAAARLPGIRQREPTRPPACPGSAGSSKEKPGARAATTWTST